MITQQIYIQLLNIAPEGDHKRKEKSTSNLYKFINFLSLF